jgi:Fur family peroxide stress response transcriptional regulator
MLTESENAGATRSYDQTFSEKGFRMTAQRREVYDALLVKRDHPTAVDVFMRVQKKLPGISLATVYNCLETLAECGLVRAVNHDRQPSRYCPNLEPHAHFFCEECGAVMDVPCGEAEPAMGGWRLPAGAVITHHEVSFGGQCGECAAKALQGAQANQAAQPTDPL